ncbi:MAG TPA: hypothetical protein VFH59_05015 [Frateuria sp.]|uniref:hypothetical protein n=1 Tax=Frateuria sp. TaxID=2211372 RepID=UPI002D8027B1|nr:hypothetical protein [Frateuria sp.]HET6804787.1 hypothetical protein [Frateuria sp.]
MLLDHPIVSSAPAGTRRAHRLASTADARRGRAKPPVVERRSYEPGIDGLGHYIESRLPGQRFHIE